MIRTACEGYLLEEAELREKLANLEQDLVKEKQDRFFETAQLQSEIDDLNLRYMVDVKEV